MPWNDSSEIVVGQDGQIYTAPVGTAVPTTAVAAPSGTFTGMGYQNQDGLKVSNAREILRIISFQQITPTRIARQSETFQLGFVLQQWNDATLPLAFGGGTVTSPSGGVYKFTPPSAGDALDQRCVIADIVDGSRHLRIIMPSAIVVETVESNFQRTGAAELPVTLEAQAPPDGSAPWYALSDDAAAFAAGS